MNFKILKKVMKEEKGGNYWFFVTIALFIFIIGMLCNFLVITKNFGMMPVRATFSDSNYVGFINNGEVNLWYLSDVIPLGNFALCSIGDIILWSSVLMLFTIIIYDIFNTLRTIRNYDNHKKVKIRMLF